jgi:hypothetical protein
MVAVLRMQDPARLRAVIDAINGRRRPRDRSHDDRAARDRDDSGRVPR